MTDTDQTREQLIEEVAVLRAQVAELEGRPPGEFIRDLNTELNLYVIIIQANERLLRERGDQDPECRVKAHAGIRLGIWRLRNMLDKTGYWMRQQWLNTEPQPRLEAVDLNATVDSVVAAMQKLAESSKVALTFATQPDLPPAQSNGRSLGSYVLHMILTNAVIYTPKGGEVTVTTGMQDVDNRQWVGFTVSDTGPGIPPDELPHVFEPYFRGETSYHIRTPGTGLGLTIARQTVDLLQGRIEIASSGIPGEGTTVTVWLPVAEPDAGSEKPTI